MYLDLGRSAGGVAFGNEVAMEYLWGLGAVWALVMSLWCVVLLVKRQA